MARTAADNLSQYKYNKSHLKRIPLDVQRAEYDRIKAAAVAAGLPVNTWIKEAIRAALGDGDGAGAAGAAGADSGPGSGAPAPGGDPAGAAAPGGEK